MCGPAVLTPRGHQRCLVTFLIVSPWQWRHAPGILWVKPRVAATHLGMKGQPLPKGIIQPQMSVEPTLRTPITFHLPLWPQHFPLCPCRADRVFGLPSPPLPRSLVPSLPPGQPVSTASSVSCPARPSPLHFLTAHLILSLLRLGGGLPEEGGFALVLLPGKSPVLVRNRWYKPWLCKRRSS